MHEFIDLFSKASSYLSLWFATAALKGFIVLGIATAICLLLRGASASMRHLCWCVALIAVLLLPVLAAVLPSVQVGVLPAGLSFLPSTPPSSPQASDTAQSAAKAAAAPRAPAATTAPARIKAPAATKAPAAPQTPAASTAPSASSALPSVVATPPPVIPTQPIDASSSAAIWLFSLWSAVAAGILLHFLVGIVGVMLLIRRSRRVTHASWTDLVNEIGDRLALRRPVRLLTGPAVKVPMTWGILRPVVLIPETASEWSDEKRRCVLAHEMAHVKRLDCLTQGIATAACAVHWFNPMAWRAAKNLRLEREKACDDSVLEAARAKASDYATHLLDIARSVPDTLAPPPVAVTMATRSQLEGRVLSILDRDRRRGLSRDRAAAAILLGACATFTLAAMNPVAAPPKIEPIVSRHPVPDKPFASSHAHPTKSATADRASKPATADHAAEPAPADPTAHSSVIAPEHASEREGIDDVIKRSFTVSSGGVLRIDADHGNIDVRTHARNAVEVEVRRQTRGRAREADFSVDFSQSGNAVVIIGEDLRDRNGDDINVRFIVTVPRQFNLDLDTAGGNIAIEDLDGTAEVRTAGGNLSFGQISGSIDASTSGGNVSIDGSDGNVEVQTSGGNIRLGRVGGVVDVRTSGGNISVEEVNGDIKAITSGGTIQARLARQPQGDCLLKTSGGSITVYLADDIAVDLYAKTSAGYVNSDLDVAVRGEIRPDRLTGTINGGGPELVLDTSAGDVIIRRL